MRAVYRIRQGLANLTARMNPDDWDLVSHRLSPAERLIFGRMQPADQLHSVRVLRWLLAEGTTDESLLKAALLHDVGKSRCHIGIVHRTLAVLLGPLFWCFPPLVSCRPSESRWWMPFYVIANHPRLGASMLAQAGCEERVWRLVELHEQPPNLLRDVPDGQWVRQALARLRRADSHN